MDFDTKRLTKAEIARITSYLAGVLGEKAFKAGSSRSDQFGPELRNLTLFPSVGLKRANGHAKRFSDFAKGLPEEERARVRHVSMRLQGEKPGPGGLQDTLAAISKAANTYIEHLTAAGYAMPLLSAVHIRWDPITERPDVHLHGLWLINDQRTLREYLEKRFADVFIDSSPTRNARRSAFYIAAGGFDYGSMESWPDWLVHEAYNLKRTRFVRPAGRFAAFSSAASKKDRAASNRREVCDSNRDAPVLSHSKGPQDLNRNAVNDLKELLATRTRLEANRVAATQANRSAPDPSMAMSVTVTTWASLPQAVAAPMHASSYTVRPVASESQNAPLLDSPTLLEIEIVAHFLLSKLHKEPDNDEEQFCLNWGISRRELRVALAMVQSVVGPLADEQANKPLRRDDFVEWFMRMQSGLDQLR